MQRQYLSPDKNAEPGPQWPKLGYVVTATPILEVKENQSSRSILSQVAIVVLGVGTKIENE